MSNIHFSEDRCIMCGAIIPEGRQVCPQCEKKLEGDSLVQEPSKIDTNKILPFPIFLTFLLFTFCFSLIVLYIAALR